MEPSPEVFRLTSSKCKAKYLRKLSTEHLSCEVLKLTDIRNPDKSRRSLKLLQIENPGLLNELASSLEMSKEIVTQDLDLLEKSGERLKPHAFVFLANVYRKADSDAGEESQVSLSGFALKFACKQVRKPDTFSEYQGAMWEAMNRENWLSFTLGVQKATPTPGKRGSTQACNRRPASLSYESNRPLRAITSQQPD